MYAGYRLTVADGARTAERCAGKGAGARVRPLVLSEKGSDTTITLCDYAIWSIELKTDEVITFSTKCE